MIPFGQSSSQIFKAFFDSAYKMCRFQQDLEEVDLDALEKLMYHKMRDTSQFFQLITDQSGSQDKTQEASVKFEEARGKRNVSSKMDAIPEVQLDDYEDDLEQMDNKQDAPISLLLNKLPQSYLTPSQQSFPHQTGKIQPKQESPESSIDEEEEEDSIDQEINMANEVSVLSRKFCRFHISGAYKERAFKMRAGRPMKYLKCPILLLKDRQDGKEYVMTNCDLTMKDGDVEAVSKHLKMPAGSNEKENEEVNEQE